MSERQVITEYGQLRRSPLWPDRGAPAGRGRGVLLIGGFGVPPRTVTPLGRWLAGGGWIVQTADLGWNTGCGTRAVDTAVQTLTEMSGRHGPVTVIGHSRGGVIGRVAAVRAPDLVASLVTVCTPWAIGPPERPGVAAMTDLTRFARRHGIDILGSIECAQGPCCRDFRDQMDAVPACPWTLIRSTADRIAGDQACVPGASTETVIATSHLGAVLSTQGWGAIGDALGT